VYFATPDADAIARKVEATGGKVIAPPFDVINHGRMAVFQDPTGAYFAVWQPKEMPGFRKSHEPNTFGWCELNTRGVDKAIEFYTEVFGWGVKPSEGGDDSPPYNEWQLEGQSIGGAMDINEWNLPAEVPPHWLAYFIVTDIDASAKKISDLGGQVRMGPQEYPGGRLVVAVDSDGAVFGLMQVASQ
jgi:uncharacterized protein